MSIKLTGADVLIVIDVQHDFLPGGTLAVPDGDAVIKPIIMLAEAFDHVILTQDWHPREHVSFASRHGRNPFETIDLDYGEQVLWPDHCIQGTRGAMIANDLDIPKAQLIIRKGHHHAIDSYSAFLEADRATPTGLAGYLRERRLERVFCVGLATDFCVAWTALDARRAGFETLVVEDACRAIDTQGSLARAWADMEAARVGRVVSHAIVHA